MAQAQKGVLCADCEHLNPPGSNVCEYCQADLFMKCRHCGETNQTVLSTCRNCQRLLHRRQRKSPSDYRRSKGRKTALTLGILVAVLGGILLISGLDWFW